MQSKSNNPNQEFKELIQRIDSFSFETLQDFIEGVMRGHTSINWDKSDIPSSLLTELFQKLDPWVRQTFEDIILAFLSDLAHNNQTVWNNEAGDELLLLVSNIFSVSPRKEDPIPELLYIVNKKWNFKSNEINLHWRAAQTLVGLNYRAKVHFWHDVYKKGGGEYAGIVLSGLFLTHLSYTIDWLENEISSPQVFNAFIARLPLLKQELGSERLSQFIGQLYPHVAEADIEDFRKIIHTLDIPVISDVLFDLGFHRLRELSLALGLDVEEEITILELCEIIEKTLLKRYMIYPKYNRRNPDVEIISCISEMIAAMPFDLPYAIREHFYNYATNIINQQQFLEADLILFQNQVKKIQEKGIDISEKLKELGI